MKNCKAQEGDEPVTCLIMEYEYVSLFPSECSIGDAVSSPCSPWPWHNGTMHSVSKDPADRLQIPHTLTHPNKDREGLIYFSNSRPLGWQLCRQLVLLQILHLLVQCCIPAC